MKDEQIYNIEFTDVLKAVKKRFYIVIIITIPALVFALYYGFNKTTITYQANVSMLIGNPLDNAGKQFQIDDVSRMQAFLGTYCSIAKTTAVSEKTIKKMNLNISPEGLKSRITAIPQTGTPFIEVRLTWSNPQEALTILDAFIEVYITEARSIYPTYSIMVIDRGKNPQMIVASNKTMYAALGLLAGIIASLLIIFALEFANTCLKSEKDVEKVLELPVLGVIPRQRKGIREINPEAMVKFDCELIEAFKILRTNVLFASIYKELEPFMNPNYKDLQTIAVTSGMPAEGKTSVASILASLMAYDGRKTILLDCNLRKPGINSLFKLAETGLSNILTGAVEWKELVHKSEIENLYVLTSGAPVSNPAELFSSPGMKQLIEALKIEFDYIIFDTPPVCLVTDAQVLSQYVDGYLVIVSSGKSRREETVKAKRLVQYAEGKILGIVLNKTKGKVIHRSYKRYFKKSIKKKGTVTGLLEDDGSKVKEILSVE